MEDEGIKKLIIEALKKDPKFKDGVDGEKGDFVDARYIEVWTNNLKGFLIRITELEVNKDG
jgi:hypothetical protein